MDNATQVGSLIVRARTGYGLYPLENAHVTVTLEDREDSKVVADVYTDNSGNTPIIKVAVEGNNRKGEYYPTGQDFTVEVAKDGYQTVILYEWKPPKPCLWHLCRITKGSSLSPTTPKL